MDAAALLTASPFAIAAFALANVRIFFPEPLLGRSFARLGLPSPPGVDAVAPAGFADGLRARERSAAVVSALALLPALGAPLVQRPDVLFPALVSLAVVGRTLALAVLGTSRARGAGPGVRVARGRVVLLTDVVPARALALLFGVQLGFAVLLAVAHRLPPVWVLALGVGVLVSAVATDIAAWVAGQPQRLECPIARAWSDALRREDVVGLLTVGPLLTMAMGALVLGPASAAPMAVLVWLNLGVLLAATVVVDAASRRRMAQRLGAPVVADARR